MCCCCFFVVYFLIFRSNSLVNCGYANVNGISLWQTYCSESEVSMCHVVSVVVYLFVNECVTRSTWGWTTTYQEHTDSYAPETICISHSSYVKSPCCIYILRCIVGILASISDCLVSLQFKVCFICVSDSELGRSLHSICIYRFLMLFAMQKFPLYQSRKSFLVHFSRWLWITTDHLNGIWVCVLFVKVVHWLLLVKRSVPLSSNKFIVETTASSEQKLSQRRQQWLPKCHQIRR